MSSETTLKQSRRSKIAPFLVMEVVAAANARAAAGRDVLHLEVGEPGAGTPAPALAAAAAAGPSARQCYTEALGLPQLRRRIAQHYAETYGVEVDPGRIAVTSGASGAFVLAFLAMFDAGDRVVVAEPGYPAYRNILEALDIEAVPLPVGPETRFQPTAAALDTLEGPLHGLIVASPSNPTGSLLPRSELQRLVTTCRARGMRLISDEIYHGITYETPADCALSLSRDAIVINSFSKYFCMTGWRLGWMVLPEDLVPAVTRLAQNLFIAPPTISQYAAIGAFEAKAELDGLVHGYRRNRDRLRAALASVGIDRIAPPDGAFYLYADVGERTDDSVAWCRRLLDETGVALTPGVDFDPVRGRHFVRLSFAGTAADVDAAADRLVAWLRKT
ncbi:MAG: aminotransferase class I/II-fold pyridoxal phosphate-dependent enzyme [Geminicoccaceae bacterium]